MQSDWPGRNSHARPSSPNSIQTPGCDVPQRRRGIGLVGWAAAASGLALTGALVHVQVRGWTPSKVEQAVARGVSPRADLAHVEQFLDAHGWPHWRCEPVDDVSYLVRDAGLDPAGLGGAVLADVPDPNVGVGGVDHGTITVVFFYDHDGRLVRWRVRARVHSP